MQHCHLVPIMEHNKQIQQDMVMVNIAHFDMTNQWNTSIGAYCNKGSEPWFTVTKNH